MIFLCYIITAAAVVGFSVLASRYIDMIDRTTRLSGAFLGGVLLSAVTSLPELFTSISATLLLDSPGLCIGNILGSNLFNTGMLAVALLFFMRGFSAARLSRSHTCVAVLLLLMYLAVAADWQGWLCTDIKAGRDDHPWLCASTTSLLIAALYVLSIRYLAADNGAKDNGAEGETGTGDGGAPVTPGVRAIAIRFALASAGIIAASIALTYITYDIAGRYNLGSGLAGALFLGVATSLPEVTSTISLLRMRSFDIAFGNITGSNVFNFFILAVADLLYAGRGVYDFCDGKVVNLTVFGIAATAATLIMLRSRSIRVKVLCAVAAAACYIAFLSL